MEDGYKQRFQECEGQMIDHPKYTLVRFMRSYRPYVIMEHVSSTLDGNVGIASREGQSFDSYEDALDGLIYLSHGPILLASSAQAIDNTFDIRQG
jgi:hypothetical protein